MPDSNTRAFTVTVDEVVYNDNSTWTANNEPWETFQSPQPLQSILTVELAKQFKIEFGESSDNLLCEQKDLWTCSCGEINRADEATCHRCRKSLSALRFIDFTEMQKRCDERVAKEEQMAKEREEQAEKKRKKAVIIAAISAAAISIILGALAFMESVIIPSVK